MRVHLMKRVFDVCDVEQCMVWRSKRNGRTEMESRHRPQGYWVRHAPECDMCLEAYTDPGVPLTLACAAPFGVTLPLHAPQPTQI